LGFLKFIKTAKLLQFCKLLKFPSIGIFEIYKNGQIIAILQIAIYKNGQIIAIFQIIKNPLYRFALQFIKTATLYISILKIEFYKNGKIIAILQNIKFPLYRDF
jgi:hypothetical protein